MDVYHKVLAELYEVTGGKDSRSVDLQELVKRLGFLGNYTDISKRLSEEGWVAEDAKRNFVRITHWGTAEAKKSMQPGAAGGEKKEDRSAESALRLAEELTEMLSSLVQKRSAENLGKVEKKAAELQNALARVRENM